MSLEALRLSSVPIKLMLRKLSESQCRLIVTHTANEQMTRCGVVFSLLRTPCIPRQWWNLDLPTSFSSPSPLTQADYYSYFLFSLFSNGAIKICIHLMSPVLSKFFHGSLSPCVKRPLVGLECCKALPAPSALQPRCSYLPPLSPSSPLLVVSPPLCLSQLLARLCTVQLWSLKFILSRVYPRHSSIHADTSSLCCSCCCSFRGTDESVG